MSVEQVVERKIFGGMPVDFRRKFEGLAQLAQVLEAPIHCSSACDAS